MHLSRDSLILSDTVLLHLKKYSKQTFDGNYHYIYKINAKTIKFDVFYYFFEIIDFTIKELVIFLIKSLKQEVRQ